MRANNRTTQAAEPQIDHGRSEVAEAPGVARQLREKFPWVDIQSLELNFALSRAFLTMSHSLTRYLMPQGLDFTRAQHNFLAVLFLAQDNRLSLGEIARQSEISPSYVTKMLDSLESDGLVDRVSPPNNRRVTYAHLTDEGRKRCEEVVLPGFLKYIDEIGKALSSEEKVQLKLLLDKYAAATTSLG